MKFFLSRVLLLVTAACLLGGAAGCSRKPKGLTPLPAGQSGSTGPVGEIPLNPGNGIAEESSMGSEPVQREPTRPAARV